MQADWLTIEDAVDRVLDGVSRLGSRVVPLLAGLGHVLAEPVVSPIDLPRRDNSAMDGFAVRAVDIAGASPDAPRTLPVIADLPAGAPPPIALPPAAAIRVMTGAPVPPGADSVVRVEHTGGLAGSVGGDATVNIFSDEDSGSNIRRAGEDMRSGEQVLTPGRVLQPAQLGVAASAGCSELQVTRRPRVAILTSGDELVDVDRFDQVLAGDRIVSTSGYTLAAQLAEIGAVVVDLGIAADDRLDIARRIEGAGEIDALITTAGISMGEHDHTIGALAAVGLELGFWRVSIRPGSPFAFGWLRPRGIPWFGLPGNPVSSMVTFEVLARPALLKMAGHPHVFRPTRQVICGFDMELSSQLTHFLRVRLEDDDPLPIAHSVGSQSSGVLTSMASADGLLVAPKGAGGVRAGDAGRVVLLGASAFARQRGY